MQYGAHIITEHGKKMAVLPLAMFNRMVAQLDDEDSRDLAEAKVIMARVKAGDEPLIPGEVVRAITFGEHPVRAWRTYRGITAEKLAEKAKISRAYLTQIEGRKRKGTVDVLCALAKALKTDVDSLLS